PFTETAGTFVNTEGRVQSFHAAVNPLGESRPGWKVLRVLGTMLGKPGTGYDSIDEVRADCLRGRDVSSLLSNRTQVELSPVSFDPPGIQRIADVPIYFADPLVRGSVALRKTPDAQPPRAWMNAKLMARLGVSAGQPVLVEGAARLPAALDDRLPDECVRIAAAHPSTAQLGPMFGTVSLKKAAVERAA
ncbi:MAG: NADH-quinone oxidoreductase subunit G, partial [Betaproteobacteria bacterium]